MNFFYGGRFGRFLMGICYVLIFTACLGTLSECFDMSTFFSAESEGWVLRGQAVEESCCLLTSEMSCI